MTPPTPEQEDSALAALTGTITERRPTTDLERDMLRVRLIAQAKEQGVPWPVIGSALGTDGKQAKKDFRALARRTQRTMLLEKARQDGITGKGTPVVVPHIDFDTPTGNPQVRARIGYGLTSLRSRKG